MAFPTTSVLTSFTQGDGNAAGFTPLWDSDNPIYVTSNQARCNAAGSSADGGWSAGTVGPDCEAYLTISTLSSGKNIYVYVRCSVLNTLNGPNAYRVHYNGTDTVTIERYDRAAGQATTLGASISATFGAGDKLGIEVVGNVITAYKYSSGAWAALGNRTDSTYPDAGYIGLEVQDSAYRVDDFGGGTVVSVTHEQVAARARNDDGSESAATAIANGNFTAPLETNVRVRFQIDTAGDAAATTYQLEAQRQGDQVWTKVA